MRPLLEDAALKPGLAHMAAARAGALELLRVRRSTPLLRLRTAAAVQARVLSIAPSLYRLSSTYPRPILDLYSTYPRPTLDLPST